MTKYVGSFNAFLLVFFAVLSVHEDTHKGQLVAAICAALNAAAGYYFLLSAIHERKESK